MGNYLKDTWCVTLRNSIRISFKDVGKGWFNLGEASMVGGRGAPGALAQDSWARRKTAR